MTESYFFSSQDYLDSNTSNKTEHLKLGNSAISYTIINNVAYCPYQSTFAQFTGEINLKDIKTFIQKLSKRVSKIQFALPPLHYRNSQKHLSLLQQAGFGLTEVDISQIRFLNEDFHTRLSSAKRNKLNRLKKILYTKKLPFTDFESCYKLIDDNRQAKNYKITIPKEKLKNLLTVFPNNFLLYGTFLENKLIACSITIKVSKTVLYQFIWAHDRAYDDISPLLFHNYKIHCEAKEQGYQMIDYGVCTLDGRINKGNYRFKKELGAVNSKKYSLEYTY